jgi:hypothetical protein
MNTLSMTPSSPTLMTIELSISCSLEVLELLFITFPIITSPFTTFLPSLIIPFSSSF